MKKQVGIGMLAAALATVCHGGGITEGTDFAAGTGTSGWTVSAGAWRSPAYGSAVDQIKLEYHGSGDGSATVFAIPEEGAEVQVATLSAVSTAATFDLPETTDFRSFRIAASGAWDLAVFFAVLSATSLDVPTGVVLSNNVTGTSFDASWNAVEGATGYRVYVWTNAVSGASAGTALWQETFANAPATESTSTTFKDSYTDSGASGWYAETVYAYSQEGVVRIGNTKAKGLLVSPLLPAFSESPLTLRVTAWRQATTDGVDMPLGIVSGDVTNIVGVVALGDEAATYHVALPALNADDRIAIFSPTNKTSARAIIDDVAIVSGYSEGSIEPAYIVGGLDVGTATARSFTDLPSVPVQFAVDAYGRRGVTSAKTEPVTVDLANPDKVAVLNACPLSSLTSPALTYTQDFNSTASITATAGEKEWLNGTTLPYWQAYKDADAVSSFNYNAGAGATGGLYVFAADRSDPGRALGAYSTQSDEFSFGITFTNDTDRAVKLSSLAYSAQQWGFKNDTNQTLSVSAKVADGLDWISAYGDDWTDLGSTQSVVYDPEEAHDTPVSTSVEITSMEELSIAPGQVLMLKWTIHSLKSGKPGMMGIDDVTVTFVPAKQGTLIKLAAR